MECPNCLHFNPKNATVCDLCQRELAGTRKVSAIQPADRKASSGTARAGRPSSGQPDAGQPGLGLAGECQKCGYVNKPGLEQCKRCDTALPASPVEAGLPQTKDGLAHCLVCPPMTPVILEEGREYVLGRGERADITLPGELVSRSHARICCRDGVTVLEDLGSSNGTLLNTQRLTEARQLSDGDSITVGGFHLRYMVRPGGRITDTAVVSELAKASTVTLRSPDPNLDQSWSPPMPTAALTGRLEEVAVPEVLQLLHVNRRSGVLAIDGNAGKGGIHVVGGEVVAGWHEEGDLHGREALYGLVVSDSGSFTFTCEEDWEGAREIMEPTDVVLLQLIGVLRDHQRKRSQ